MPISFTDKIGEGGSAVVYRFPVRGEVAALKLFRQPLRKREIERISAKLMKLNHENLVRFVGYSEVPSCIALEYCEFVAEDETVNNVSQLLEICNDDNLFEFKNHLEIIQQASRGLEFLHNNNIVHKDFKPMNLLTSGKKDKMIIKVSDFDDFYSIKATTFTSITRNLSNIMTGFTLAYSSEEICLQTCQFPSFATDVFSWALKTFQILTGNPSPWSNVLPCPNDCLLINALKSNKRPSVKEISSRYDNVYVNHINEMLSLCWATNPKQ